MTLNTCRYKIGSYKIGMECCRSISLTLNGNDTEIPLQVTLEEQMICGALQTLNEEAFEDVVCSERPSPSPTGQPGEMNALLQQQLAPIRESVEYGSLLDDHSSFGSHNGLVLQDHANPQIHATTTNTCNNISHGNQYHNSNGGQHGIDPLPTVIIIPSNTVDDTPL